MKEMFQMMTKKIILILLIPLFISFNLLPQTKHQLEKTILKGLEHSSFQMG
jgi:hypothetical protein